MPFAKLEVTVNRWTLRLFTKVISHERDDVSTIRVRSVWGSKRFVVVNQVGIESAWWFVSLNSAGLVNWARAYGWVIDDET